MRHHNLRSLHPLLDQANTWHHQFQTNRQSKEPYRINESQWVNSREKDHFLEKLLWWIFASLMGSTRVGNSFDAIIVVISS